MAQQQMAPEKKRKKKAGKKLSFDAGAVFDVEKDDGVTLDLESSRFVAQKGQGGDRRE